MVIVTAQQMKFAEKTASEQGLSYLQMMENAGKNGVKVMEKTMSYALLGTTLVLCGSGNNGGDGYVVARCLANKGFSVKVVMVNGQPKTKDAQSMANQLAEECDVPIANLQTQWDLVTEWVEKSTLIVDGVFGTGFHGQLSNEVSQLFAHINHLNKTVVALDLPSGVCADTGEVAENTLHCLATVSFHAYKFAHVLYPARTFCGTVTVVDIGIPNCFENLPFVIERSYVEPLLYRPNDNTHKGSFGTATLFVGSKGMAGAATFAVKSCLRCGTGLVKPIISEEIYPLVAPLAPEGVYQVYNEPKSGVLAQLCMQGDACLIGCGSGKTPLTGDVLLEVMASYNAPLVLDADGINSVCSHIHELKERTGVTVITPHPGEMARLTGKSISYIQENRVQVARAFAQEYGVIVVLKGAGTVIANPTGRVAISLAGNSGLSKGGSGDVLAGMVTAFLAQGIPAFESACIAVWLHGKAGEMASQKLSKRAMLPSDVIETLPGLFLEMETE